MSTTAAEALQIVLDLAKQNVIDIRDEPEEHARQMEAISLVDPKADHELSVLQLEDKYTGSGGWGECPDWPRQVWREEVMNENTQCGYWDWTYNNIQSEEAEVLS